MPASIGSSQHTPPRYFKAIKTDCVVFQNLPKKFWPDLQRLTQSEHHDGTSVYRFEDDLAPLQGHFGEPRMEASPVKVRQSWRNVEDPVQHCLEGRSLMLAGMPGTGKTHTARHIVSALRPAGKVVALVSKTHCSVQNLGMGAKTADHWVRRTIRNGSAKLDWLVVEEITQLDVGIWSDLACLAMNPEIRFLLIGDPRQLPAALDCFAGAAAQRQLHDSPTANCCGTWRGVGGTNLWRTSAVTPASSTS